MTDDIAPPHFALSIKQPWAELIVTGKKTIEVRTWTTPYRGRFWVHVGQRADDDALLLFPFEHPLFTGGFIGAATIARVDAFTRARWSLLRCHHLVPGPMPRRAFGWEVGTPRRLTEPVPAPGQLGLFEISPALAQTLHRDLIN